MNLEPGLAVRLNWLLNHSLQAGLLVLLVLVVQWLFRRQLTSRWRFALWWIVLLRLMLPFSPESAVSLFNVLHPVVQLPVPPPPSPSPTAATPAAPAPFVPIQPIAEPATLDQSQEEATLPGGAPESFQPMPVLPDDAGAMTAVAADPPHSATHPDWLIPSLLGLWLGGVLVLTGVVAAQVIRFYRKLAPNAVPANAELRDLLEECRNEFRVSRKIELLETDAVQSPALSGLFRLRLLLPRGMGAQFGRTELRYIFLHELAHVRRGDLWLNWLVTVLQIVHWFNPLLWLGFARLRADRELACDELALLRAGDQAGTAYGETVVKLLENLSRPAAIPGLVGILEDRQQMRRRISMIARFRRPGRWSVLAVLLLAALAAAALTDAQTDKPAGAPRVAVDGPDATGSTYDPYFISENRVENRPNVQDMNHQIMLAANDTVSQPKPPTFFVGNTVPYTSGTGYYSGPPRHITENYEGDVWETNAGDRPDLTGTVTARDGSPLPVPATVIIVNAAPKAGAAGLSSSYSADCGKQAQTDAQGHFKIASLNPAMIFNAIVTAKGYQTRYLSQVDPVQTQPIKAVMLPLSDPSAAPNRTLHGRVLDAQSKPIAGAVVETRGVQTSGGISSMAGPPFADRLAVTDEQGEFLITSRVPFARMAVKVTARNYAPKRFDGLPIGTTNDLALAEGVQLKGRLLAKGEPLADMVVGISDRDPRPPQYIDYYEARTDAQGNFHFSRLPADADLQVYTRMDRMQAYGAAPILRVHTGLDGETTEAGDLTAGPAHRLAGRVVLADGQPLPAGSHLTVWRNWVWDSMQVPLDEHGGFAADGIPSENISLRVRGYQVSTRNDSADQMNPFQINGLVDRDLTNLVVLLEKGPATRPKFNPPVDATDYVQARQRTLHGAEPGADHSSEWRVSGRVIDRETKQPIASFQATPGMVDIYQQTAWNDMRVVDGSNGWYLAYVSRSAAQPLLKVEADGYLPASIKLAAQDATNADIELVKGSGPAGTVVGPDGQPVAGATVVMLNDEARQARIDSNGKLTAYHNDPTLERATDAKGYFSFQAELGMRSVVAASSSGFGMASMASFATNQTIIIEPFGKITGTLTRSSQPGTDEELRLTLGGMSADGPGQINLPNHAVTDAQGRFVFDRVPPGQVNIIALHPVSFGGGQPSESLEHVQLQPGQTLAINISAPDRPVGGPSGGPTLAAMGSFRPPGFSQRILGETINGVILQPDGQPAAEAEVALHIFGRPLMIGKGRFASTGNSAMEGLLVRTGPDGSFTLPTYLDVESVIALNRSGYARLTLGQVQQQPQITLQKWGRIEGTLHHGQRPAVGAVVSLSTSYPMLGKNNEPAGIGGMVETYSDAYNTITDDQGRFVLDFVPPGQQNISQGFQTGGGGGNYHSIGSVAVSSGETAVINITNEGSILTGKLKFSGGRTFTARSSGLAYIVSQAASTNAQPPQTAAHNYSAMVQPDGSFQTWDVPPGEYRLEVTSFGDAGVGKYNSTRPLVIPPAGDDTESATVDWGEIQVTNVSSPFDNEAKDSQKNRPAPVLISKGQLKGFVLQPDGSPAAGADVALQIDGKNLGLGRKGLYPDSLRQDGLMASTGPDGAFTLPWFDETKSIVAFSPAGFAQVTPEQFKTSPQIKLKKWGRIEGTLFKGNQPDANEDVQLGLRQWRIGMEVPSARTDAQGRFVFDRVVPGDLYISRIVQLAHSGWMPARSFARAAVVHLDPGQTFTTNIVRTGRFVTGQLKFTDPRRTEMASFQPDRYTPVQVHEEGVLEPAQGFNARRYFAVKKSDGHLHAEDLPPGRYVVEMQDFLDGKINTLKSSQPLIVPAGKDENDETPVDWGDIAMTNEPPIIPATKPAPGQSP